MRSLFSAPLARSIGLFATIVAVGCGGEEETPTSGPTQGGTGGEITSGGGSPGSGAAGTTGGAGGVSSGGGGSGGSGAAMIGNYDCTPPSGAVPALKLTEVASGVANPLLIKGAPGDDSRLYIIEQDGRIKILEGGVILPTPFLDIEPVVNGSGEQGLLGLAFHPDYQQNGRFFVHYDEYNTGITHVVEYARSADPAVAEPSPVAIVFTLPQPYPNHKGGSLEFGADGMLYIFLGDGGSSDDPQDNGQNLGSLLGKILRIDVTTLPYTIPPGNLPGGLPEIWDYGLRNPYRSSFDACTGDMYIGDVGQNTLEEVNVEPKGQGNKNYGWRLLEASICHSPATDCDPNGITTLPTLEYPRSEGACVIGGYVYRGSAVPGLRGTYIYGDYSTGHVWSFVYAGGIATAQTDLTADLGTDGLNITSFGQDNYGEVYVMHVGGSIYRIDPE